MRQSGEKLMDEDEMYWPEVDEIELDSVLEATNNLGVDILDFCINQIDVEIPFGDEYCLEEDKFMVIIASVFFEIVSGSLEETKKLKSMHTVKITIQLTAVSEHVKICTCYLANNCSSKLCTNASLAIAWWIRKTNTLPVKFMRTIGIYSFIVIFHTQNLRRKEASGPYWTIRISSRMFVSIWLPKSMALSPHTSFVNMSTMLFFPP